MSTLADQANKALVNLSIVRSKIGNFPFRLHFKLFDTTVLPILLYASEIWGYQYYEKIEKIQRKWCRMFLGLPSNAQNEAVIGECGRFPVFVSTMKRCVKFWLRILELPESRLPRQAYVMLVRLDLLGRRNWATSIKNVLFSYGFGFAWLAQGVGNKDRFLQEFEGRVKDVCKQKWWENINKKPKMRTYIEFKSVLEVEKYLFLNLNFKVLQTFACFRCACLPLNIEEGRHENIACIYRFCKICNLHKVEDEFHFLLECPAYNKLRLTYIAKEFSSYPNQCKFNRLLRSSDNSTLYKLCLFVHKAFQIRKMILDKTK